MSVERPVDFGLAGVVPSNVGVFCLDGVSHQWARRLLVHAAFECPALLAGLDVATVLADNDCVLMLCGQRIDWPTANVDAVTMPIRIARCSPVGFLDAGDYWRSPLGS